AERTRHGMTRFWSVVFVNPAPVCVPAPKEPEPDGGGPNWSPARRADNLNRLVDEGCLRQTAFGARLLGARGELLVGRVADLDEGEPPRGHDDELARAATLVADAGRALGGEAPLPRGDARA